MRARPIPVRVLVLNDPPERTGKGGRRSGSGRGSGAGVGAGAEREGKGEEEGEGEGEVVRGRSEARENVVTGRLVNWRTGRACDKVTIHAQLVSRPGGAVPRGRRKCNLTIITNQMLGV